MLDPETAQKHSSVEPQKAEKDRTLRNVTAEGICIKHSKELRECGFIQ